VVSIQAQNSFSFVAAQTFTVTVESGPPVNDAPSFTAGPDQVVTVGAGAQTAVGWATNISAGTIGQVTAFNVMNNTNTALFSAGPANDAATGTLTYTPAAAATGSATVTITLSDNGGTENGGANTSPPQSFTITVNPLNVAPSFTVGANQLVLEDSGAKSLSGWATNISPGPANEAGQTLSFTVTNNDISLFSAQPSITADGTLTYTPAADANGQATVTVTLMDDGGTAGGGADTSAQQTFLITVTAVNDAPGFTAGGNQTVAENATPTQQTVTGWATNISAGPANESGQALTFDVSNDNNSLFSVQPAISAGGTLTFTQAANATGSATVTVTLKDDGGVANNGADTSPSQSFTITVNPINDAPSFTAGANQTVAEDSGAQTVSPWATNISAGSVGQLTAFNVSNNNNSLFSVQPSITTDGTLSYTPAPNANGSATVTVTLSDDGGQGNGGVDTSGPQNFVINVTALNDAPSFTAGGNQTVREGAGAQSVTGWASNISPGPADEAGQTVSLNVSTNNDALFSDLPAITANGTLTYTPAPNATGSATVTVSLSDNGATGGGNVNTSGNSAFTITVNPVVATPQVVFADSFGNGLGNWTQDQNDWFIRDRRATDGIMSAEVDGSANDALLVSPIIDVAGRTQATVSFSWYIESGFDSGEYLAFDVSLDGGQTWQLNQAMLRGNVDQEGTMHNVVVPVDVTGVAGLRIRFRAKVSDSSEDGNLDNVIVTVSGSGPAPTNGPVAEFSAATAGLQVSFTDTSSTGSAPINAWAWDFGDGNSSTAENPVHTYAAGGTYTVTLTVTDTNNETSSATHTVAASEPGTEVTVFEDSFENGLGLWSQDSQNDWFTRDRRATDGIMSAEVDGRANDSELVSPVISVAGKTVATVTFSWRIEANWDTGEYIAFDVSVDGGDWEQKAIIRGNVDPENTTLHVEVPVDVTNATSLQLRFRAKVSGSGEDGNLDNVIITAR